MLIDYSDTVDARPTPVVAAQREPAARSPRWGLIVVLVLTAPFVWTVGPVLSGILVVLTVLLPFLALITVPLMGLVGALGAGWTAFTLRELSVARQQHKRWVCGG